jgi:hypothetical protein
MKYLKIQNKGELDIRLIALMGGTTKADNPYKIGEFGSGLKYTLAYLFRNNLDFKIFIGEKEVDIKLETENINGDIFEIICINGHRTSITTKMGKDWQAWMIVRELWSNALDEGEAVKQTTEETTGLAGTTTFYIQIDADIRAVIHNWGNYFIHDQLPMHENETHAIYSGGDTFRLYKNGILIHEDKKHIGLFCYDIKDAAINELREFKGNITYEVVKALAKANEKVITHYLENIKDEHYEGKMDYNWYVSFAETWKNTIGNAKLIHEEAVNIIKDKNADFDLSGTIVVPKCVYKFLSKQFNGIGSLRTADKINEFFEIHSQPILDRIKEGLAILEACDYFISPELTFICGVFGNKNILAQVNTDAKQIYLSERLLDQPLFDICAMLIEENEHFRTGMQDETRQFQQHFINLFTKTLLAKNSVRFNIHPTIPTTIWTTTFKQPLTARLLM